jgi:hypothetical protein
MCTVYACVCCCRSVVEHYCELSAQVEDLTAQLQVGRLLCLLATWVSMAVTEAVISTSGDRHVAADRQ